MAIGVDASLPDYQQSVSKLISFLADKPQSTVLCCGHISDCLDGAYLTELLTLLQSIRSGTAQSSSGNYALLTSRVAARKIFRGIP